eukprot:20166-Heterococcus_DN1.PRE.2
MRHASVHPGEQLTTAAAVACSVTPSLVHNSSSRAVVHANRCTLLLLPLLLLLLLQPTASAIIAADEEIRYKYCNSALVSLCKAMLSAIVASTWQRAAAARTGARTSRYSAAHTIVTRYAYVTAGYDTYPQYLTYYY